MIKYFTCFFAFLIIFAYYQNKADAQPQIGIYPPQVHQQICQESTFIRYLGILNSGDETLAWSASFTPGPYDWVTAEPAGGETEPGDTSQIAFHFNSSGLAINNYYAYLLISSNDPVFQDTTVLAMLHVQDLSIFIEPESDSICFGCSTTLNTIAFGCSEEYQFSWASDPPGFTSTDKSPVVSPVSSTTYTVTVTDGGGTAEKSAYIQVYGSSDIYENQPKSTISLFPNPTRGEINLSSETGHNEIGFVRIYDLSGRMVSSGETDLFGGTNRFRFNAGLEPGIYVLSFEDINGQGEVNTFKVVIIE